MKILMLLITGLALALGFGPGEARAEEKNVITLPAPDLASGRPLMAVLKDRRSDRQFKNEPLSEKQTAEILWAALGVNRPEDGNRRTSPTAMNHQDVYLYALNEKGAFRYDAVGHSLEVIAEGDQTKYLAAPLGLVFVAPADNPNAGLNVGYCAQNVYLYAASAGLNTVSKVGADREALSKLLKLPQDQAIILVQPVGPRP